jgi:hypothetical protein
MFKKINKEVHPYLVTLALIINIAKTRHMFINLF